MDIDIDLMLPHYLVKYMRLLYGEPYEPKGTDEIGIYVLSMLERKPTASEYRYSLKKHYKGSSYKLRLSQSCMEKRGCYLESDRLALIHKYIDSHFRRELFRQAVVNYHKFQIPYKVTLLTALQMYDITEGELSYETLRKDFNRKKGAIEEKLIYKGKKARKWKNLAILE